jgi:hypothetical protein
MPSKKESVTTFKAPEPKRFTVAPGQVDNRLLPCDEGVAGWVICVLSQFTVIHSDSQWQWPAPGKWTHMH